MLSRRKFLHIAGAGAAGFGLDACIVKAEAQTKEISGMPRIKAYRDLGKTGLKLSDIGCGAINFYNPNVLRYAYDCGVTHFDTAEGYLNTNSERMLGQALQDVRDKVVITTKHLQTSPASRDRAALVARVEASLKRLQTDYLDIALVHSADEAVNIEHEEVTAAYTLLKQDGKARFIGFSTHDAAKMLPLAIQSGIWDVVLLVYNHMEGPAVEPLIAQAHAKGIGIIAMKVFAGGMQGNLKSMVSEKVGYSQAAIRWVLANPNVDVCIVTLSTFSHVDEYVSASGMPLQRSDRPLLSRYGKEAGPLYCRVSCRECLAACTRGVAVNDVLRYAMYFENYGMEKEAMQLFRSLDQDRKPLTCASCSAPCQAACPFGLRVRERLLRSQAMLQA